jgi:hypothetical protein
MAFAVLSNAVNLWMDEDGSSDLATAVDDGFDLLHDLCGEGRQAGRHDKEGDDR